MKAEKVYNYLNENKVKIYSVYEHRAVYTMEEAQDLTVPLEGTDCKNLFLKAKKEERYFLISVIGEKRVDLKKLTKTLGVKKLNFAREEKLIELLGVEAGAVTPMGLINDMKGIVEYYIDEEFQKSEKICVHPNCNMATMTLEMSEFIKYLASLGREIRWIEVV